MKIPMQIKRGNDYDDNGAGDVLITLRRN